MLLQPLSCFWFLVPALDCWCSQNQWPVVLDRACRTQRNQSSTKTATKGSAPYISSVAIVDLDLHLLTFPYQVLASQKGYSKDPKRVSVLAWRRLLKSLIQFEVLGYLLCIKGFAFSWPHQGFCHWKILSQRVLFCSCKRSELQSKCDFAF